MNSFTDSRNIFIRSQQHPADRLLARSFGEANIIFGVRQLIQIIGEPASFLHPPYVKFGGIRFLEV